MPHAEEISRRIASIPVWRHRIEVAPGIVTPGTEDTATEWTRLGVPADLRGRRVLDIGCSDGFYAFECERRGAEVVAIDDESSLLAGGRNGFSVAAELLDSAVSYRCADVHELDPDELGHFDHVLFVNVLYHLRNPILALDRIASVVRPGGTLHLKTYYQRDLRFWVRGRPIGLDLGRRPKWWFFPTTELGGDPTNWFAPNRAALEAALSVTGWTHVEHLTTVGDRLYYRATRT